MPIGGVDPSSRLPYHIIGGRSHNLCRADLRFGCCSICTAMIHDNHIAVIWQCNVWLLDERTHPPVGMPKPHATPHSAHTIGFPGLPR
jgi:hypothetical protein